MYRIVIVSRAKKELKNLTKLHKQAILEAVDFIREFPFEAGKPLTKQLTGFRAHKVGLYRIIYKVNTEDKIIIIFTAAHRAIVYQ